MCTFVLWWDYFVLSRTIFIFLIVPFYLLPCGCALFCSQFNQISVCVCVYVWMCVLPSRANLIDEKWESKNKWCAVNKNIRFMSRQKGQKSDRVVCKVLKVRVKMSVICRNYRPFFRVHKRAKHHFIWKSALGFIN